MSELLNGLNEAQKQAATTIDGPLLILAGAGSGKTKTITSRLAYLLGYVGIDPKNTLTLTFTNKAAAEMRQRAMTLLRKENLNLTYPPLLCTFHKFGLLFLKFHMQELGRKNSFVVIDNDDKKRIIKNFDTNLQKSLILSEISKYKNSLINHEMANKQAQNDYYLNIAKIYEQYENYLQSNNLVDFDDLLALPYQILLQNEKLANFISDTYQYISIDEYQDTNELQYKLVKLLCKNHDNLCVVGDDDQSIYGWRGANIKNILDFSKEYKNAKVIKLENNYRSTPQILKVANELISYNKERLGKVLNSVNESGKEINYIESIDEAQEAKIIANRIKKLILDNVSATQIAVLYRINALSRSIEEGLRKEKINYKMVGGVKFYERAEIKDIISYLRIISNPHDDFSLRRVINRPKRGLGQVSIDKILKEANLRSMSIFEFLKTKELKDLVSKKAYQAIKTLISDLQDLRKYEELHDLVDKIEEKFAIKKYYSLSAEANDRLSNIDEFYGFYKDQIEENPHFSLEDFLNEIAISSEQDLINDECISIMSIHASKGLEFDYLFVIGFEEGFFPLNGDGTDIEEERRLGYVAITRAKKELTLSSSKSRFYKGRRSDLLKSRFLKESGICKGSIKIEKSTFYKKGDLIKHKIFGIGRVVEVSKVKREFKLKINFGGIKRDILASFVERI